MKKQNMKINKSVGLLVGLLVALVLVSGCASQSGQTQQPSKSVVDIKQEAKSLIYDELFRNNAQHVGEIVYFKGQIVQVEEMFTDSYVLRVATKPSSFSGYSGDVIWVDYRGNRLLENDVIDVWGTVKGLKTYTALLGQHVTVPEVSALRVESQAATANITISYSSTLEPSITSGGDYPINTDPDSGKIFLKVKMTIKNNGYDKFDTNPFSFHVTVNSIKYDYDSTTYELADKLDSTDILNGGTLIGSLLFQIPQSVSNMPFTISYDGYCNGLATCTVIWSKA